jgi:hypothetical protein
MDEDSDTREVTSEHLKSLVERAEVVAVSLVYRLPYSLFVNVTSLSNFKSEFVLYSS